MMTISPAHTELLRDRVVTSHETALSVYGLLLGDPLIGSEPRAVKVLSLAAVLGVRWQTVQHAVGLLIERGYLVECGRNGRDVRLLYMPARRTCTAERTHPLSEPLPAADPAA